MQYAEQRVSRRIFVRDAMTRNVIKVREDADMNEVITLLYAFVPAGLGAFILVVIDLLINNLSRSRSYPENWFLIR